MPWPNPLSKFAQGRCGIFHKGVVSRCGAAPQEEPLTPTCRFKSFRISADDFIEGHIMPDSRAVELVNGNCTPDFR